MNREKGAFASSSGRFSLFVGGLLVVLVAGGCVPQDKYDNLLTSYRTLQEENIHLKADAEGLRSTTELQQSRMGASSTQLARLDSENQRLRSEVDRLEGDYQRLLTRLDSMELGPLPDDVDRALRELASRHPSLLTYDSRIGMVRFSSDLTFALGSVDLTPEAKRSIAEFARIANNASIAGYELRLVGHTDTVPITNPTTKARHPTNLHLSVHRAISVADTLSSDGVASNRIQVAGYGPYRPIVPNGPGGAAENRRVEIFIVPMKAGALVEAAPASTPSSGARTTVPTEEPMK